MRRTLWIAAGLLAVLGLENWLEGQERNLRATLTGAAEVPGPGDPDGGGEAALTLKTLQGMVCVTMTVTNIEPATAAHIHEGAAGIAGPAVVTLPTPVGGSADGCVPAARGLIRQIRQNPAGFYVNVHNAEFPAGAVRGQLAPAN